MRLIDADLLIERMGFYNTPQEREENAGQIITLKDFDNMPTAYNVDAVVRRLESQKEAWNNKEVSDAGLVEAKRKAYDMAIKIAKGGGVNAETDS